MNRLDSIVSRSSFFSPVMLQVEKRAPGVAVLPLCRRIRSSAPDLVGGGTSLLLQDGHGDGEGDCGGTRSGSGSSWRLDFCLFVVCVFLAGFPCDGVLFWAVVESAPADLFSGR
jgi:hypothetical protein